MQQTHEKYHDRIATALATYDKETTRTIVPEYVADIFQSSDEYSADDKKYAEKILQELRRKRMFEEMQEVAEALIQTGGETFKIRRQYAQALIDRGQVISAIGILKQLAADTAESDEEHKEAWGLIGRAYKQSYIHAKAPANPRVIKMMQDAIEAYYKVYLSDKQSFWHGINVIALLKRAAKDGVPPGTAIDPGVLALEMLENIRVKGNSDMWDWASAMEACVALEDLENAQLWLDKYLADNYCDAFELGSTLRQMQEVWQLDGNSEMGALVITALQAALMKREGGGITLQSADIAGHITAIQNGLEKNFGNNTYIDLPMYEKGLKCCRSVARISRGSTDGSGTGFIMRGSELSCKLNDDPVLLTNAHVIHEPAIAYGDVRPLMPSQARVSFDAINANKYFRIKSNPLLISEPSELDVTIWQFADDMVEQVKALTKECEPYIQAFDLPVITANEREISKERVYVIGHPNGGPLKFSMQDNILLDHQDPRLHYRTPTEPGSSGSPIFNQQWELMGIHHAGKAKMPMLNNKEGTYEANEGLWIQAIRKKLDEKLPG